MNNNCLLPAVSFVCYLAALSLSKCKRSKKYYTERDLVALHVCACIKLQTDDGLMARLLEYKELLLHYYSVHHPSATSSQITRREYHKRHGHVNALV